MHLLWRKVGWSAISLCRSSFEALLDQRTSEFLMRYGNRLSYPHCHPTVIFGIFFVHVASSSYTILCYFGSNDGINVPSFNECVRSNWNFVSLKETVRHGHTSQMACKENHFSVVYNYTCSLKQMIFLYIKQADWCGLRMKRLMELTKSRKFSLLYFLSVQPHISVDFISRCYFIIL